MASDLNNPAAQRISRTVALTPSEFDTLLCLKRLWGVRTNNEAIGKLLRVYGRPAVERIVNDPETLRRQMAPVCPRPRDVIPTTT